MGSSVDCSTFCFSVVFAALGQATYSYSGTDNYFLVPVTLNRVTTDGICEANGGEWPLTMTLTPL